METAMSKKPGKDGEEKNKALKLTKHLRWRLDVVMRDRRIKTASALQSKLQEVGLEMSRAQVARVIAERPARINSDLLDALVEILDCDANDLLTKEDVPIPGNVEPVEKNEAPVAKNEGAKVKDITQAREKKEYTPRTKQP